MRERTFCKHVQSLRSGLVGNREALGLGPVSSTAFAEETISFVTASTAQSGVTNYEMPVARPGWVYYLFALRDELPLALDAWSVSNRSHATVTELHEVGQEVDLEAWIWRVDGTTEWMNNAFADLNLILGQLTGHASDIDVAPADAGDDDALPRARYVAITGAPLGKTETAQAQHYKRAFGWLQDAVAALNLATHAPGPHLSIERVSPVYMILFGTDDGSFRLQGPAIVEHGFGAVPQPDERALDLAAQMLVARRNGDPVELFSDFAQGAYNAAYVDGDYVDAAVRAATACELLLKHTAWMLTWEASVKLADDPRPGPLPDIFKMKPSELIGRVLAQRLGGSWSSSDKRQPVGGWREYVARQRNRVVHRGARPNENDIKFTIEAVDRLLKHVCDRLAANVSTYPLTASLLVSGGLESRGVVAPKLDGTDRYELIAEYRDWLETSDTGSLDD